MKQTDKQPLISVIMPVYNGSRFVTKAIDSILGQTYQNFELLVVNDGSTDDTWKILKAYKEANKNKIRLYRMPHKSGAFVAANYALAHARGQFIAPMDSDDVSRKDRLAKQVAFLIEHRDVILVGSNAKIIDAMGHVTGYKRYPTDNKAIYNKFALVNPIIHPSCMVRRSMLPNPKRMYATHMGVNSDYYTFFELLNFGKFANISEELLSYRIHGANSSLQNLKEKFFVITQIRLDAMKNLRYKFPLRAMPILLMQYMVVSILPANIILPLYLMMRGMKKAHLPNRFDLRLQLPRKIRYAIPLP